MEVSKRVRKQKLVQKTCQYPNCGCTYYGAKHSKYCPTHRQPEYRIRKRPEKVEDTVNQRIELNLPEGGVEHKLCTCGLEGCNQTFQITVSNRVTIYPKYCPEHRNEFKRNRHLQSLGLEPETGIDHNIDVNVEEPNAEDIKSILQEMGI